MCPHAYNKHTLFVRQHGERTGIVMSKPRLKENNRVKIQGKILSVTLQ